MARLEISSINPTGRWDRIDQNFVELYAFMDHMEAAWSSEAATITAGSGTYVSVTGSRRYKQVGKTIHIQLRVDVTAVGTGTGVVNIDIPVAAVVMQTLAAYGESMAHEGSLRCLIEASTTQATFQLTDPTDGALLDVAQNGTILVASGTYETT